MARPLFSSRALPGRPARPRLPMEKYRLVRRALLAGGDTTEDDWRIAPGRHREPSSASSTRPPTSTTSSNARWTPEHQYVRAAARRPPSCAPSCWRGGTWRRARGAAGRRRGHRRRRLPPCHGRSRRGLLLPERHRDRASARCSTRRIARAAVIDTTFTRATAPPRIFQDDDAVFTFSIHQENNYPVKERSD